MNLWESFFQVWKNHLHCVNMEITPQRWQCCLNPLVSPPCHYFLSFGLKVHYFHHNLCHLQLCITHLWSPFLYILSSLYPTRNIINSKFTWSFVTVPPTLPHPQRVPPDLMYIDDLRDGWQAAQAKALWLNEFWFPKCKRGRKQLYLGQVVGCAKICVGNAAWVPMLSFYITRFVHLVLIHHISSGTWHHHNISQLSRHHLVQFSFYELYFTSMFSMDLCQLISYHLLENPFSSLVLCYDPSSLCFCYSSFLIKPINWCPKGSPDWNV